jgi:ribosomal protein S18 acetylase RimI-like enzyme
MFIRKGITSDIDEIECLYNKLNEYLSQHVNYPGWIKGIYPIRQDAEDGVNEDALFVVIDDDRIAGTFILRHTPEPAYNTVDWGVELPYEKIYVIYTLAVAPEWLGNHVGDLIMDFIIDYAQQKNMKAIRLDVYSQNTPAIRLYEKHGFQYIDIVDLRYSEYGLDWYKLYQYILN